jgi:DNA-binding NarL/FixJ family response regulator
MKSPKLIIVDNNLTFRKRLIFLINVENSAEIIGEASNEDDFLNLLANHHPDIVLIDVDMPELNGINVIQKALNILPGLIIFAFTMFGDDEYIIRLTKNGVRGFILKSSAIFELDKDIHSLLRVKNYCINNQVINILKNTNINCLNIYKEHKRTLRRVKKLTRRKKYAIIKTEKSIDF